MKKVICLSIILFFISTVIFAQQKNIDKWTQIVIDALDYDENGIPINIYDIEMALKNGANPNYISEEGNSFLTYLSYYTSEYENNDIKNKIIKAYKLLFNHGAKLQYVDRSILYFPIANGCYEVIKLLLENGASATFWPTDEIGSDITPIELATAKGHEDIITLLESYGAERLGKQESAQLRFIEASQFGTIDEMEEARKKGAIVNKKNRQNETALLNALICLYNYDDYLIFMYLLDLGADVNLKGRGQFCITTPLHETVRIMSHLFKYNNDTTYAKKILNELINRGAFVSARDEDEKTPLHIAAKYNNLYAANLLLESGSKVMPRDNDGKTPLDYAESGEMIQLLKSYGAKEY